VSASLSKGPGPVRECLDEAGSRVYYAVQFCKWALNAKNCLEVSRCESGPLADRLRALARSYGQAARGYYAAAMGREGFV
jgi:hypothetical protein